MEEKQLLKAERGALESDRQSTARQMSLEVRRATYGAVLCDKERSDESIITVLQGNKYMFMSHKDYLQLV